MPWVKLDEHFPTHPKVLEVGTAAAWLYVCGLCYSNANLTDGRIPKRMVPQLMARTKGLPELLEAAGLWDDEGDVWAIHDFHDYQPSAHDVRARRRDVSEARAAAGSAGGSKRAANRKQNRSPDPTRPDLPNYIEGLLTLVPEEPVENLSREDIWKKLRKTETA